MDNPVFLICSERSGSNFITKIMNSHSRICGPSTKHLMNPVLRNIFRYEPLKNKEKWELLIDDMLNLYNASFSMWKSNFTKNEIINNVERGNYIELINYFFRKEQENNSKDFIFIKEIKVYEFFPYLLVNYPNAKYVYQVRDPRDMALSWKKSPSHKGGVVMAAKQWKIDQQNALKNKILLKDNIISVKYEELIDKTSEVLSSICGFLKLEFESSLLDFHKDKLTIENAKTQPAWNNLSKGVIKKNSNKYLKELTKNEILFIEAICYNEMAQLNYNLINSRKEVEGINFSEIENYNTYEIESLIYKPAHGVKENMAYKKVFYER